MKDGRTFDEALHMTFEEPLRLLPDQNNASIYEQVFNNYKLQAEFNQNQSVQERNIQ